MLAPSVFRGVPPVDMQLVASAQNISASLPSADSQSQSRASSPTRAEKKDRVFCFQSTVVSIPMPHVSSVYEAIPSHFLDVLQCFTKPRACERHTGNGAVTKLRGRLTGCTADDQDRDPWHWLSVSSQVPFRLYWFIVLHWRPTLFPAGEGPPLSSDPGDPLTRKKVYFSARRQPPGRQGLEDLAPWLNRSAFSVV